jgi:hypothetical protein
VALYITFEALLSGTSMNPARTLASALPGGVFEALWLYFAGPAAGMLLAVEPYRLIRRTPDLICAKLNHHTHRRCIFVCGYAAGHRHGVSWGHDHVRPLRRDHRRLGRRRRGRCLQAGPNRAPGPSSREGQAPAARWQHAVQHGKQIVRGQRAHHLHRDWPPAERLAQRHSSFGLSVKADDLTHRAKDK